MDATSPIVRPVRVKALEHERTGTLTVHYFSPKERMERALKSGALSLGCTILCVFIPVAHFILVPLGAIFTPILAYVAYRQESSITASSVECPACGAVVTISGQERYPLYEYCPQCRREIAIHRA